MGWGTLQTRGSGWRSKTTHVSSRGAPSEFDLPALLCRRVRRSWWISPKQIGCGVPICGNCDLLCYGRGGSTGLVHRGFSSSHPFIACARRVCWFIEPRQLLATCRGSGKVRLAIPLPRPGATRSRAGGIRARQCRREPPWRFHARAFIKSASADSAHECARHLARFPRLYDEPLARPRGTS